MAVNQFSFPQVQHDLGLTFSQANLFPNVPVVDVRAEFRSLLSDGAKIALSVNTEKARSEFMIAPVLLELHRQMGGAISLFSGIELDGDAAKGLNGICDFILTRTAMQFVLTAPLITIVEAKNDNVHNGLGQCIASMVAAELFNRRAGTILPAVFGAVSTGSAWMFLKLAGNNLTLDLNEYYIDNVGKILGILKHILETV